MRPSNIIKGMEVWEGLVQSKPSFLGGTPTLDRLKTWWHAPHDMLRELVVKDCLSKYFEAKCDCKDREKGNWCKHAAALGYQLIEICETKPLDIIFGLGLDTPRLLQEAQQPPPGPARKRKSNHWGLSTPVAMISNAKRDVLKPLPSAAVVDLVDCVKGDVGYPTELD